MVLDAAIWSIALVRMDMASVLYGQASASLHGREGRLLLSSLTIRLGWGGNNRHPIIVQARSRR